MKLAVTEGSPAAGQRGRTSGRSERMHQLRRQIWHYRKLYVLLSFGVIFFALFAYGPMYGIQLAFKQYSIAKGITHSPWVGLDNFQTLFGRQEFWIALKNTLIISFLRTVFSFPVPIILAIILNELYSSKLRRGLQIVFTLPHFLSWVTISGIMMNLLSTDGMLNSLITALGGQPVGFLTEGNIFRGLLVFSGIWKEAGWSSIIYMAAIVGIDPALYESATIDGASRFQRIWHITWPGIRSTAAILLIMSVGYSISGNFDQVFNLYNPIVMKWADIIDTYVYRISFQQTPDYGLSTAVGLFKGVVNCILLLSANFIIGRLDSDSRMI
ncbi:MAG: binding-protein-dependent transport system inner rane component [Paenibacillaceae bacterium]|nr:binding-protein-dependent transport system inner rane component [Paenibacillaceae bacterium]